MKCTKRRHVHVLVDVCSTCMNKVRTEKRSNAARRNAVIARAAAAAKRAHVLQERQAMENPLRRGLDPKDTSYSPGMASLPEWDTPPDDYSPPKS